MVVSISHNGYIKRTPSSVYRAQRRGGKGIKGAEADEEDPVEHLFVTSTHDYLFFKQGQGLLACVQPPQLARAKAGSNRSTWRGRKDRRLPRRP
jgi:DNA gyrase subunit A